MSLPLTGSRFPLKRFEQAIGSDDRITSVVYTGSLGLGTADQFSDLDIEVWVVESAFDRPQDTLRYLMSLLGDVEFVYERGPAFVTGFLGGAWQRVDIGLHQRDEIPTDPHLTVGRVVKDTTGRLAGLVRPEAPPPESRPIGQARSVIEEAVDSQIYLALHNARGAVWSAMGEVTHHTAELYGLLGSLRGRDTFGFRYLSEVLSPEEQAMLRSTWPAGPERDEVRRAGRALWEWTRYVWAQAEERLGPLGIELDQEGLMGAVDRLYER